jgi:hypothetical protein
MTPTDLMALSNLLFPAFTRLRRTGNKHHLFGIEKAQRKTKRVSMSRFAPSSAGLAFANSEPSKKTFQRTIGSIESKAQASADIRDPPVTLLAAN